MIRTVALALLLANDSSGTRAGIDPARCELAQAVSAGDEHVFSLSIARAAGLAAAGRRDGAVQVWNAATWGLVRRFEAHSGYCYAAVFSPDGRTLATSGIDGALKLWSAETWTLRRTLRASGDPALALAFAPGGRRLVAGGGAGAQVWDVEEGRAVLELGGHALPVSAVAVSGDRAATAGLDGAVRIWDLAGGRLVKAQAAHAGCAYALAFSTGGGFLVSGGSDRKIQVWDAATGERVRTLEGHAGAVHALAFASGGRHLVSAGRDGVRLWEFASGKPVRALEMPGAPAYGVAIAPDGRGIVGTGGDNRVWVWGAVRAAPPDPAPAREGGFLGVSYVDGGGAVVSAVIEGTQAEKTGFQANDVITGVDEVPVEKSEDFLQYMRQSREGDEVNVKLRRGGATKVIRVKLGKWK